MLSCGREKGRWLTYADAQTHGNKYFLETENPQSNKTTNSKSQLKANINILAISIANHLSGSFFVWSLEPMTSNEKKNLTPCSHSTGNYRGWFNCYRQRSLKTCFVSRTCFLTSKIQATHFASKSCTWADIKLGHQILVYNNLDWEIMLSNFTISYKVVVWEWKY